MFLKGNIGDVKNIRDRSHGNLWTDNLSHSMVERIGFSGSEAVVLPRPGSKSIIALPSTFLVLEKELNFSPIHQGHRESLGSAQTSTLI